MPFLTALVLSLSAASGQEEFSPGLLFSDYSRKPETSLNLTPRSSIPVEGHFTLSFEISIWDDDAFGFIFWAEDEKGHSLAFSYVDWQRSKAVEDWERPDTSLFVLTLNREVEALAIPVAKTDFGRGRWHKVSLAYDLAADSVAVQFDGARFEASAPLPDRTDLSFIFGFRPETRSVPRMALRHIRLSKGVEENTLHHWPLKEWDGEAVRDDEGNRHGAQKNGEWLARRHVVWEEFLKTSYHKNRHALLDGAGGRMLTVGGDSLVEIPFSGEDVIVTKTENPLDLRSPSFILDAPSGKLFASDHKTGEVSIYDPEKRRWSDVDKTAHSDEYHGAAYTYSERGGLLSFGGYGHYRAKNGIRKYDLERGVWDTLKVTGDRFEPRSGIHTLKGFDPNKIFLAGGHGNETGKQEFGFEAYHDIWEFDAQTLTLRKIADFGEHVPGFRFHHIISLPDEKVFYCLGGDYNTVPTEIQIYEVRLEPLAIRPVGRAEEIKSYAWGARMVFDSTTRRLILMHSELRENSDILEASFYSLDYPPLTAIAPAAIEARGTDKVWVVAIIVFLVAAAVGLGVWVVRRRETVSFTPRRRVREAPPHDAPLTVQVFGEYAVFVKGSEIPHRTWESEKARLLFLYLVLKNGHGISVDQVTLLFWPDASKASATNSRNSAISRIRHTLGDDGAEMIVRENQALRLAAEDKIDCDLYRFEHLLGKESVSAGEIEQALEIYGEIGLAPEVDTMWIGPIREHYHRVAVRTARKLGALYKEESDWNGLTRLGRQVLKWDALDDDGIWMVVKGLHRRDKPARAHEEYQKYLDHYLTEVGETYEISFQKMIE